LNSPGQDVYECLGGLQNLSEDNLGESYKTLCDPRLNASQSLEFSFRILEALSQEK
jgi:3-deoxy-7-phosphoheptulonate synthase